MDFLNPKISIIVPFYNEEKEIERCLNSILNQTYTDFECILVDDSSTDRSPEICDKYVLSDKRFKVIHKPINQGLPKARKTGLDNANSEFIIHCDSDDWLEPDALHLLYERQKSTNASIVRTNMMYHTLYKSVHGKNIVEYDYSIDPLIWFLLNGTNTLCGTLYRKSLFANYIVPENFAGEDGVTNIQIFSKIKPRELYYLNSAIYNYDCKHFDSKNPYHNSYLTIWEDPVYRSKSFIKILLSKLGKDTKEIISAYSFYMISSYIIPYLKNRKKILRREIFHFYNEYWKNCEYKYLLSEYNRLIIPLFYFSILLGHNYFKSVTTRKIINKIYNIIRRYNSEGIIVSVKYYFKKYFCFL
jgi:glycosyltransferase involved in cell wall biosynthesis